jgi:hypothetical protein
MNEETTMILIDTALASGSATALDPEERKLQELVLTVREDAPAPDPDFALRMNARVAAGFPSRRRGIGALFTMRPPMLAMGAAATLLIALVVALSVTGGSNESGQSGSSSASTAAGSESAPSSARAGSDSAGGSSLAQAPSASAPAAKAVGPSATSIAPAPAPGGFVGGRMRSCSQRRRTRSATSATR